MLPEEDLAMEAPPSTAMSAKWTFSCGDIGEEDEVWGGMQVASSSLDKEETVEEEEEEKTTPKRASSKVLKDGDFSSIRDMGIVEEDKDQALPIHSPTIADGMTPLERARLQLSKKSETASARSRQKASLKMSLNTLAFTGAPLDT